LLRRLSVFSGGFALEAAEAVCGDAEGRRQKAVGSPDPAEGSRQKAVGSFLEAPARPLARSPAQSKLPSAFCLLPSDVLDLLTQLVGKSLVGVERREGTARYVLLETTREYAQDRLQEASEQEDRQLQHARFFLALAERGAAGLRGATQADWLQRLEE